MISEKQLHLKRYLLENLKEKVVKIGMMLTKEQDNLF
jgi:hypothetical protein